MKTQIIKREVKVKNEDMIQIEKAMNEVDCRVSVLISFIKDKDISEELGMKMTREYMDLIANHDQYMRDQCKRLLNDDCLSIFRWEKLDHNTLQICAEYEVK